MSSSEPYPAAVPDRPEHHLYPAALRLTGRKVVVVGGGHVAQRRLPALIAAGAMVDLVSPVQYSIRLLIPA